jgi:hypothetical protein
MPGDSGVSDKGTGMRLAGQFRRRWIQAAVVLAFGIGVLGPAQTTASKGTRISLGTVSAPPKGEVMAPLYLTPDPSETRVGSISARIRFDSSLFTFVKAEKGFLLDGVGGEVTSSLEKDPKDAGKSSILLEVATKGEPRKALREGLVLTLVFRIGENAPAGQSFPLTVEEARATDIADPPKAVQPLVSQGGTIEVIRPEEVPYVACFFFSH